MADYRFALVGDPVAHSRSPDIHRVMLRQSGLGGDYVAVRAGQPSLRTIVADLRRGAWDGLNVTMPLKTDAAMLADDLSEDAARAGSVNTLLLEDERVLGETTDCSTFRRLLEDRRFRGTGDVLILGSGGSAAAALAAMPAGRQVYLSSRRTRPAQDLGSRLGGDVVPWGSAVAGVTLINATPIGMRSELLPAGVLEAAAALIDLPYGPKPTPSATWAGAADMPFADGHEFLIRQAMASFELWTGVGVPYEQVVTALRKL